MQVKYVGADAREIDDVGVVKPGDIINVPATGEPGTCFAGRPPAPRLVAAMQELRDAHLAADHARKVELVREITGWIDEDGTEHPPLDDGAGLLQQYELWAPVNAKKKTTAPAEEAQP